MTQFPPFSLRGKIFARESKRSPTALFVRTDRTEPSRKITFIFFDFARGDFLRTIKIDSINQRIINQLVGSAGSIGANYCEATEAESKKDFIPSPDYDFYYAVFHTR